MSKQGINAHPIISFLEKEEYKLAAKAIAKCADASMADGIFARLQKVIEDNKKHLRSIDLLYFKCWKAFLRNSALTAQLNENDLKSLFRNIYKLQGKLTKEVLKAAHKKASKKFKDEQSEAGAIKQSEKAKKKAKDKVKDHENYQALEALSIIFFETASLHSRLPLQFFFREMKANSKLAEHLASKINYLLKLNPELLNLLACAAPYEVLRTLARLISMIERPDIVALSQLKFIFVHCEAISQCVFEIPIFKEQLECLCEALQDDAAFKAEVECIPRLVQNKEIRKTLDRLNAMARPSKTFTPRYDSEQDHDEVVIERLSDALAQLSLKPSY